VLVSGKAREKVRPTGWLPRVGDAGERQGAGGVACSSAAALSEAVGGVAACGCLAAVGGAGHCSSFLFKRRKLFDFQNETDCSVRSFRII
jgi:hypothetical protein